MIEYLILAGAVVVALVVGLGTGLWVGLNRRPPPYEEPKPICGCRHHASFHDDKGCHYIHTDYYDKENHRCGCVRYVGPIAYDALP